MAKQETKFIIIADEGLSMIGNMLLKKALKKYPNAFVVSPVELTLLGMNAVTLINIVGGERIENLENAPIIVDGIQLSRKELREKRRKLEKIRKQINEQNKDRTVN